MTQQEFEIALESLKKEFEEYEASWKKRKQATINRYVREHARFSVGDIIEANGVTIRVDGIYGSEMYRSSNRFYTLYRGVRLTKKLEPMKTGEIFTIYDDGREINKIVKKTKQK